MLKINDLTKFFNHQAILLSANIEIVSNRINLLVGPNGCGKTTIIKLMLKLLHLSKIDHGSIECFTTATYMPEKMQFPELMKVDEYLEAIRVIKRSNVCIKQLTSLWQLPNKTIKNLSKGMRQKLAIIQTVLSNVDYYFFDEPTDGLDEVSIKLFISSLKTLLEANKTIVIITHNKKLFKELSPKIFSFKNQKIYATN